MIGNGFDLAHGLPTKYTDFLFFCSVVKKIIKDNEIEKKIPKDTKSYKEWLDNNESMIFKRIDSKIYMINCTSIKYKPSKRDKEVFQNMLDNFFKKTFLEKGVEQKIIKEILYLIFDNFWIDYFLQCDMHGDENWIDFESEISNVIKSIDNDIKNELTKCKLEDKIKGISNKFLNKRYIEWISKKSYKELRNVVLNDLDRLIRALEIYLAGYVEKLDYNIVSPDIELIINNNRIEKLVSKTKGRRIIRFQDGTKTTPVEKELEINYIPYKIISFNYTNTYMNIYNSYQEKLLEEDIDYIHGKADINNTIQSNNMVLGIDEYLSDDEKDKNVEFIAFKKFYQRIYKETGCEYRKWINDIRDYWKNTTEGSKKEIRENISNSDFSNKKIHRVYIFGHSLDVTDRDILRDLILNDNVYTTIFYLNKDVMGQQIANLVKVIGQDELIKRTGGSTKTIEFKQQQEMIPIDKLKNA